MTTTPTPLNLEQFINAISKQEAHLSLKGITRGIEKESLRITGEGYLSQTAHPKALGSTLTHPHITTDYSEALLELITEPLQGISPLLQQLQDTHQYVYQNIGDELLWVNSMPCILGGDESIPIAQYGSSNIGKMKTVYRHGLWHRYGRLMQAIAGIHFNFSLPESFWQQLQSIEGNDDPLQTYISDRYFKLIRNFQRFAWLPVYLFGASPAVCASFIKGRQHNLQAHSSKGTFYHKGSTSLRMSDLGYQNDAQSDLMICYNSLESYTKTLDAAIKTPYQPYQDLGIKVDGTYKQLNANILQIENEYYSNIRPKQTAKENERPTQALLRRGVEYIEVRSLDLDPFEPLGISADQVKFFDAFLLFCLLEPNDGASLELRKEGKQNLNTVVYQGRETSASIVNVDGSSQALNKAATDLLSKVSDCANLLDQSGVETTGPSYQEIVSQAQEKVDHPETTTSGRILNILENDNISFFEFAINQANSHREFFQSQALSPESKRYFDELSTSSLAKQTAMEAEAEIDFDLFVANYFKD